MRSLRLACVLGALPLLVTGSAGAQQPAARAEPAPPPEVEAAPTPPPAVGAAPPRVLEPPSSDSRRSGVLIVPFVGLHSFQNDDAKNLDAGLRVGVLVGGRINEMLSIGGQAALDVVNPKNVPSGEDVTAWQLHVALSPLLHAQTGPIEIVLGPKLGFFFLHEDISGSLGSGSESIHGWLYGANLGAFAAANAKVSIGGLLSFDFEKATEACFTVSGQAEMCSSSGLDNTAKVLGVALAALF
jgi:hypothetical protein